MVCFAWAGGDAALAASAIRQETPGCSYSSVRSSACVVTGLLANRLQPVGRFQKRFWEIPDRAMLFPTSVEVQRLLRFRTRLQPTAALDPISFI